MAMCVTLLKASAISWNFICVCDTILNHFLKAVSLTTRHAAAKLESELQVDVIQEDLEGWWPNRDSVTSMLFWPFRLRPLKGICAHGQHGSNLFISTSMHFLKPLSLSGWCFADLLAVWLCSFTCKSYLECTCAKLWLFCLALFVRWLAALWRWFGLLVFVAH